MSKYIEDIQEIPHLRNKAFPRHLKKESEMRKKWQKTTTKKQKKKTTHMKAPTHEQRRTATEEALKWNKSWNIKFLFIFV